MKTSLFSTMTGRKIRVAVVGCGRISKNHFGSIEQHAHDLELAAVRDIDAEALMQHTDQYKVLGVLAISQILVN